MVGQRVHSQLLGRTILSVAPLLVLHGLSGGNSWQRARSGTQGLDYYAQDMVMAKPADWCKPRTAASATATSEVQRHRDYGVGLLPAAQESALEMRKAKLTGDRLTT